MRTKTVKIQLSNKLQERKLRQKTTNRIRMIHTNIKTSPQFFSTYNLDPVSKFQLFPKTAKTCIVIYLAFLLRCSTKPYEWGTQ